MATAELGPEQRAAQEKEVLPQKILVAGNKGFCEGVKYATSILWTVHRQNRLVNPEAITYCLHPIVHNNVVREAFEQQGIIFTENVTTIPQGSVVVFSAHGHPPEAYQQAKGLELLVYDATCPLVIKVHKEARHYVKQGYHVVYNGKQGHREAMSVIAEIPSNVTLITSAEQAKTISLPEGKKVLLTQTTHSVTDARAVKWILQQRFPDITVPEDICFATRNRQAAVTDLIKRGATLVLAVGSPESSNTRELVQLVRELGAQGQLVEKPEEIDKSALWGHRTVGLTSGASAPEAQLNMVRERVLQFSPAAAVVEINPLVDESAVDFRLPANLQELYNTYVQNQPNWEEQMYGAILR